MSHLYDLTNLVEGAVLAALAIAAASFGLGYYDGTRLLALFNAFVR